MRRLVALSAALVGAVSLVAAGCGSSSSSSADPADLEGTPWVLTSGVVSASADLAPTATFADGRVAGFGGCNRYSAQYSAKGDTIAVGQVAGTQIACEGAANDVESSYFRALQNADTWSVSGDTLTIRDDAGNDLLGYTASTPAGKWTAIQVSGPTAITSPLEGSLVTADFAEDGTLSGTSGCNRYSTTYTQDKGVLTIGQPIATKAACSKPPGVMDQEAAYLAALPTATRFERAAGKLTLLRTDGTIVAVYADSSTVEPKGTGTTTGP